MKLNIFGFWTVDKPWENNWQKTNQNLAKKKNKVKVG